MGVCLNCGAPLGGTYCSECGQEAGAPDFTLRGFLGDLFEHIVSFDSRAWRTLVPLLVRPGQVTARYLAGQRVRFVPPVRLYLFVSLVYFLLLAWIGPGTGIGEGVVVTGGGEAGETVSTAEAVRRELEEQGLAGIGFLEAVPRALERITENPDAFRRSLIQGGSYLMFFLLPAFAVLLGLFYHGRRRPFLHHLLFAVHFHVFLFVVLGLRLLLVRPGVPALEQVGELLSLAIPVYLFFALRRVYGGGWVATALRTAGLGVAYGVLIGVALITLLLFLVVSWAA